MAGSCDECALLPEELESAADFLDAFAGGDVPRESPRECRPRGLLAVGRQYAGLGIALASTAAVCTVLSCVGGSRGAVAQTSSALDLKGVTLDAIEHSPVQVEVAGGQGKTSETWTPRGDDDTPGPKGNRDIAMQMEKSLGETCAATGASCLVSKCCQDPGRQCYTKDAWWGECMETCIPGPNLLDQMSPAPWACEALGVRTPGKPKKCTPDGQDCRNSGCCTEAGTQCFEKDKTWAACRAECVPGPDLFADDDSPWSCKALGPRTLGAAPWVNEQCSHGTEDCGTKACCADSNMQCYRQHQYYAGCRESCTAGEKINAWENPWECGIIGPRTPAKSELTSGPAVGQVKPWVAKECHDASSNCLDVPCCKAVGSRCFKKNDFWAACQVSCSTEPDANNETWACEPVGPVSFGLPIKGYPSLYCITLFMPSSYEGPLMARHLKENAGIFMCDGYDLFAAEFADLGTSKDGIDVKTILIPQIPVGQSQDGTAGNAKLFMAVWDKVIAGGRFRNYDWTIKVDPDAVLIAWRVRDHMKFSTGQKVYVVNCNKFPGSPNFPMMYGAVEIFSSAAMIEYALNSWKCGTQLPWGRWGEDYYMTHCMDFIGVGRIGDFGVLGDNMCTGANCLDTGIASFHPFKTEDDWLKCWGIATAAR